MQFNIILFPWQKRCQQAPIQNGKTMKRLKISIRRGTGEATSNSRWRIFFNRLIQIVKYKPSSQTRSRRSWDLVLLMGFVAIATQFLKRWVASSIFVRVKKKNSFSSRTVKKDWWDENVTMTEESICKDWGRMLNRSGSVNGRLGGPKTEFASKISLIHSIPSNHRFPKKISMKNLEVETCLVLSTAVLRSLRKYIPTLKIFLLYLRIVNFDELTLESTWESMKNALICYL